MKNRKSVILIILFMLPLWLAAQQEARLLRFPTIYGNQVVFTYTGDLYTVDKAGGVARKLTADIGFEMFARFSPDGKNIAFTGQYDGNTEIYMIPAGGGVPKRLTYTATLGRDDISDRMGPNNIVMTWKDNNSVVFRSRMKSFNSFKGQLYTATVQGGLPEELPLPCGGFCSYSPDGTKLAFNRVFREFRTWKYYKGGMADDIWIYDFASKQTINITNNIAQDIYPMWKDKTIYFLSDRDRIMNLFSYNTDTKEIKKLTDFTEYDIKFPSLGDKCIIFENGGYIYTFDLATQEVTKINVIIADDESSVRIVTKDASKNINSIGVSPDGKRIAFDARGDVFTVPAKNGITRNLTKSSGAHDRDVTWSPDGKNIAYISDATGEDEIYIIAQDGSAAPVQLTKKSDTYKYAPMWSPDSKKLLWADKKLRLQYIDIETQKVTQVSESKTWEFTDFSWSPDSKWIALILPERKAENMIYLYELATAKSFNITDGWFGCGNPVFSPDGKYLYFTSQRDYNPTYSWTEWNHAYTNMTCVYFVTLAKSTPNPFAPENDEVSISENKDETVEKAGDDKSVTVNIDPDGIIGRIIKLPIDAGSYWNIQPVKGGVYYVRTTAEDTKPALMYFDLKDKKENNLGEYSGFDITADYKKMLVVDQNKYSVIDLPKSKIDLKEFADLSNMSVQVDLKAEWKQIFNESWRQMRDFFYDPNMHGVDWPAIRKKYEPLAVAANTRADLTYVIGEMIGELSVGHSYVGGGDRPLPKKVNMGLLGAQVSRDKSGYFRIDKILKGENWTNNTRSPLSEVGVDIKEGDYIIAVNSVSVTTVNNIYELLINTADKQVELTVNGTPAAEGAHKTIVVPIADEAELYYYNWVQNNIRKVNEATDGKVGYIHIPDMGVEGLNEFVKYYYPQLTKKALIIDDRGNGGGNVSPMIIERLNRELVLMKMSRNTDQSYSPDGMQVGPKVCLIDCYSASDGDLFPYQFKTLKIGKVIGMRSWGGVVGIRGSLPFVDGGTLNKPEFAHYAADGKDWIIEGHGVDPDIVVDNDPAKEYIGDDEQLNKAIEVILEELKNWPKDMPAIPQFPDKTK
jgi:tricorn protease